MEVSDFKIVALGDKRIVIGGIGRMYYEDGFPIAMAISVCRSQGLEVSLFHIVDELQKNGFSSTRALRSIEENLIPSDNVDIDSLYMFCESSYECQREMIFEYMNSFEDLRQLINVSNL